MNERTKESMNECYKLHRCIALQATLPDSDRIQNANAPGRREAT